MDSVEIPDRRRHSAFNIPRALRESGFEVLEVRDCGLRGKSDEEIFNFAQTENATLLTADLGFGNILRFPVGSHSGIVIIHLPNEISVVEMNRQVCAAIDDLAEEDFRGSLIVIEPGKVRIRRPRPGQ